MRFGLGLLLILGVTNAGLDTGEGRAAAEYGRVLTEDLTLGTPVPLSGLSVRGPDGRFYPAHELGNAAAMVPVTFAVQRLSDALNLTSDRASELRRFAVSFLSCLYVAASAAAVWFAVVAGLQRSAAAASGAALLLVFTTYLWPYSRTLFDGVLAGTLVAWAASLLLAAARRPTGWLSAFAGAALGAAVATRFTCVLLVPAFLWYVAKTGLPVRYFVAGLLPFAVWQGYYNALRTGSAMTPAVALPAFAGNNAFAPPWIGAAGLFLSPGKAIWFYAPTVVLALLGFRGFWRDHRPVAWLVILTAGPFVLLHASIRNWSGDWGWGPRYLVTILPLLFLAVPFAFDGGGTTRRRWAAMLIVAGMALQVPAIIINWEYRYIYVSQQTGRTPDAWSLSRSQLADALGASARNLRRAAGSDLPPEIVEGAHPINVYASNHVNLWWLTVPYAGVPSAVCLALAASLLLGGVALLWPFLQGVSTGIRATQRAPVPLRRLSP